MPATSQAAIARRRERNRTWYRTHPRERLSERIEAADESYFVLTCSECFGLFDVPRRSGRLPSRCPGGCPT